MKIFQMAQKSTFTLIITACLTMFLCSCVVLETKFIDVTTKLEHSNARLAARVKKEIDKADALEKELQDCNSRETDLTSINKGLEEDMSIIDADRKAIERKLIMSQQEVEKVQALAKLQKGVIDKMEGTRVDLEFAMQAQLDANEVKIEKMENMLKVTFIDKIMFNTGSVRLNSRGKDALLKVANSLKDNTANKIDVRGHTDNMAIGLDLKKKYNSNWELSVARAASVVRFLIKKGGLDPTLLTASGYSYYRPVADNSTREGRRQNRRIEMVLVPRS